MHLSNVIKARVIFSYRTNRKRRDSREILILFGWYCLYAWGTSLGITIATVCLDNTNLTAWPSILKPPFDSCFVDGSYYWFLLR